MDFQKRLRPWELALLMALCVALAAGALADRDQRNLSGTLVRLHVVANSDSDADQAEKLQVRDKVLALLTPLLSGCVSQEEAVTVLEDHRAELEALGDLRVSLGREYYPTRVYGAFALPAGEYVSLRVILGEGRGRNWWCVVYPPLCTEALAAEAEPTDAFLALGEEGTDLITQEGTAYELRFRAAEWWGRLRQWWDGRDE